MVRALGNVPIYFAIASVVIILIGLAIFALEWALWAMLIFLKWLTPILILVVVVTIATRRMRGNSPIRKADLANAEGRQAKLETTSHRDSLAAPRLQIYAFASAAMWTLHGPYKDDLAISPLKVKI